MGLLVCDNCGRSKGLDKECEYCFPLAKKAEQLENVKWQLEEFVKLTAEHNQLNKTYNKLLEEVERWQHRVDSLERQLEAWQKTASDYNFSLGLVKKERDTIQESAFTAAANHLRIEAEKVPMQHEDPSKGCATYNWMMYCADLLSPRTPEKTT